MPRYIDADALTEKLLDSSDTERRSERYDVAHGIITAISIVTDAPTADVAPIVWCKDCRKWMPDANVAGSGFCPILGQSVGGTFYCYFGSKKDGGDGDA